MQVLTEISSYILFAHYESKYIDTLVINTLFCISEIQIYLKNI